MASSLRRERSVPGDTGVQHSRGSGEVYRRCREPARSRARDGGAMAHPAGGANRRRAARSADERRARAHPGPWIRCGCSGRVQRIPCARAHLSFRRRRHTAPSAPREILRADREIYCLLLVPCRTVPALALSGRANSARAAGSAPQQIGRTRSRPGRRRGSGCGSGRTAGGASRPSGNPSGKTSRCSRPPRPARRSTRPIHISRRPASHAATALDTPGLRSRSWPEPPEMAAIPIPLFDPKRTPGDPRRAAGRTRGPAVGILGRDELGTL